MNGRDLHNVGQFEQVVQLHVHDVGIKNTLRTVISEITLFSTWAA